MQGPAAVTDDASPPRAPAPKAAPQEVELKLHLPADAVRGLLRHPALAALRRGSTRRQRLVSVYCDTPDGHLARAGVGLRLRRSHGHWLQTLKGPARGGAAAGLAVRDEFEWPLAGPASRLPALDLGRIAETPWSEVVARALRKAPLGPRFTTDFMRTTIPLGFADGTTAMLCIDRGNIVASGAGEVGAEPPRVPISELEVELGEGDPARLFELVIALVDDLPLRVETQSKAARGFALVEAHASVPVHAEAAAIASEASTGEALGAFLGSCIDQIAANRDGLLASEDPEWIHQMRVGVRRLRSALDLLRDLPLPVPIDPLRDEARWLGSALGPARDLDVFAAQTLPMLAATAHHAPPDTGLDRDLEDLTQSARERLPVVRATAREAVASARFERLLLSVGRLAVTVAQTAPCEPTGEMTLGIPAKQFASRVLDKRARKLKRHARKLA